MAKNRIESLFHSFSPYAFLELFHALDNNILTHLVSQLRAIQSQNIVSFFCGILFAIALSSLAQTFYFLFLDFL